MAKFPPSGSRRMVAQFVQDQIDKLGLSFKAIQPMILGAVNDKFYWALKIIDVKPATSVGIARKYEIGFVIIEHGEDLTKLKTTYSVIGTGKTLREQLKNYA